MKLKCLALILCIFFLVSVFGCVKSSDVKDQPIQSLVETVYLKNNIHVQKQTSRRGDAVYRASYANYTDPGTGHMIIPVNTPVTITTAGGIRGRGIAITTRDGKLIHFEFNSKNMMGMQPEEYFSFITSPSTTSITHLSSIDQKGIADGKAYTGMTKDGVRIALGYPALHKTPSLNNNTWTYWKNRFTTRVVEFGNDGKVISIQ
jgi:hypothetical protein